MPLMRRLADAASPARLQQAEAALRLARVLRNALRACSAPPAQALGDRPDASAARRRDALPIAHTVELVFDDVHFA